MYIIMQFILFQPSYCERKSVTVACTSILLHLCCCCLSLHLGLESPWIGPWNASLVPRCENVHTVTLKWTEHWFHFLPKSRSVATGGWNQAKVYHSSWPGYLTSKNPHCPPLSFWLSFCEHVQWSANTESNIVDVIVCGCYWKKLPSPEAYKPRYSPGSFNTLVWNIMDVNGWLTARFGMRLHCRRGRVDHGWLTSRGGRCQPRT